MKPPHAAAAVAGEDVQFRARFLCFAPVAARRGRACFFLVEFISRRCTPRRIGNAARGDPRAQDRASWRCAVESSDAPHSGAAAAAWPMSSFSQRSRSARRPRSRSSSPSLATASSHAHRGFNTLPRRAVTCAVAIELVPIIATPYDLANAPQRSSFVLGSPLPVARRILRGGGPPTLILAPAGEPRRAARAAAPPQCRRHGLDAAARRGLIARRQDVGVAAASARARSSRRRWRATVVAEDGAVPGDAGDGGGGRQLRRRLPHRLERRVRDQCAAS